MNNRILLFLFLFFLGGSCYCMAESKGLSKKALKSCKKVCKQLKQDGWAVYDKEQPLEDAMMQYYIQSEAADYNVQQVIGMGRNKDVNKAYRQAKHRTSVTQASQKQTNIDAITEVIMSSSSGCSSVSNTVSSSEQAVESLTPVISLCRTMKDGTTEINLYYLIKY